MRLSRMIAVAGFLSAVALPTSALADVMMTTSGSTATGGSTTNASTGAGSTSGTGSGGEGGGDSGGCGLDSADGCGGCSVQPGQAAGAVGLAAIPALALLFFGLRRKKSA